MKKAKRASEMNGVRQFLFRSGERRKVDVRVNAYGTNSWTED